MNSMQDFVDEFCTPSQREYFKDLDVETLARMGFCTIGAEVLYHEQTDLIGDCLKIKWDEKGVTMSYAGGKEHRLNFPFNEDDPFEAMEVVMEAQMG